MTFFEVFFFKNVNNKRNLFSDEHTTQPYINEEVFLFIKLVKPVLVLLQQMQLYGHQHQHIEGLSLMRYELNHPHFQFEWLRTKQSVAFLKKLFCNINTSFIHLLIYLSVHQYDYTSIDCPSIHLSIYLSVHQQDYTFIDCPSIHLSIHLSVHQYDYTSINCPSIHLSYWVIS